MKGKRASRVALALILPLVVASTTRTVEPSQTSATAAARAPGALVIVGGGGLLPVTIRDRFLELAGGKKARLVVIPTASARFDTTGVSPSFEFWKSQGVASVVLLHARSREQAERPDFVKPLTEATGVWLTGGDQSRLAAVYHGTAVERELIHLLTRRGGVIGGTSAGASIMGALMITGGNPTARVGDGFGLLPRVVVDQHFSQRNRLDRLLGVLATHPDYVGLGIDEQTAVVVRGHTLSVLGDQTVRLCWPGRGKEQVRVLKAGETEDAFVSAR
jgi:cyanophycinase